MEVHPFMSNDEDQLPKNQKPNTSHLFLELIICVILPTVILKYMSADDMLGPVYALIFGLSFPLLFGVHQFIKEKKFGFIPALGFISILLTSGIGLLELDPKYIAFKEMSIPLLIAIGTIVSLKTRYPLVKTFIYNEKIYENLFELNKSIILLISPINGDIINANSSAIEFYGYEKKTFLTLNISDINSLSKKQLQTKLHLIKDNEQSYFKFTHKLANNTMKHVRVFTFPAKYGDKVVLFSTITDITEEYETKNKLTDLEEEFKNFFEFSNVGLTIRNKEGSIIKVNSKFLEMFGYGLEKEILGKSFAYICSKDINKEESGKFRAVVDKEIEGFNLEEKFIKKDGAKFDAFVKVKSLNHNTKYILSSFIDITEVKAKDRLLSQQSKMAAMGEMIGNIAHQWRQPLSSISSLAISMQLKLEMNKFDEHFFNQKLKDIGNSVQHMSKTIDYFREFFKPQKEKKVFNFKDIYEKTIVILEGTLTTNHITLISDVQDIEIDGFDSELIQVMMNIINNACDVLANKKSDKFIFIETIKENNSLIISIKDNAGGIPNNIINRIFEPYFTTKHKAQGTGIGLYMSNEIITKHMNGIIIVNNVNYIYKDKKYEGAQFKIILPLDSKKIDKS